MVVWIKLGSRLCGSRARAMQLMTLHYSQDWALPCLSLLLATIWCPYAN